MRLVEISPVLAHAIEAWIAMQPEPKPSWDAALERALQHWLDELGLLPSVDGMGGAAEPQADHQPN